MNFVNLTKGRWYYSERQTAWNPEYSNKAADPTDPRRTSQFIPSRSQTAYGFGRSDKLCQILSQNGKFNFNFGKTSLQLKRISDRISDVF